MHFCAKIVLLTIICSVYCQNNNSGTIKVKDICSICTCNNDTGVLDCNARQILTVFTEDEWNKLMDDSKTNISVVQMQNNELTHLLPFPALDIKVSLF